MITTLRSRQPYPCRLKDTDVRLLWAIAAAEERTHLFSPKALQRGRRRVAEQLGTERVPRGESGHTASEADVKPVFASGIDMLPEQLAGSVWKESAVYSSQVRVRLCMRRRGKQQHYSQGTCILADGVELVPYCFEHLIHDDDQWNPWIPYSAEAERQ
eukprot:5192826-Prymnesium_polylepis.1